LLFKELFALATQAWMLFGLGISNVYVKNDIKRTDVCDQFLPKNGNIPKLQVPNWS